MGEGEEKQRTSEKRRMSIVSHGLAQCHSPGPEKSLQGKSKALDARLAPRAVPSSTCTSAKGAIMKITVASKPEKLVASHA